MGFNWLLSFVRTVFKNVMENVVTPIIVIFYTPRSINHNSYSKEYIWPLLCQVCLREQMGEEKYVAYAVMVRQLKFFEDISFKGWKTNDPCLT